MKIKTRVGLLLALAVAGTVQAVEPMQPPQTSGSKTTLSPQSAIRPKVLRTDITNAFVGSITEVLIYPGPDSENLLINDALKGKIQASHIEGNVGYASCNGGTLWSNLINDASTFPGNMVLAQLVQIQSRAEQNDITLGQARLTVTSNDGPNGGALNDSLDLAGRTLNDRALMIKTDGTPLNSGSTDDVMGESGLLISYMNLFVGDPNAVRTYVKTGFVVRHAIVDVNSGLEVAASAVRVGGISVTNPVLHVKIVSGSANVSIPGATTNTLYMLRAGVTPFGPWKISGMISNNVAVVPLDQHARFFQAVADPIK